MTKKQRAEKIIDLLEKEYPLADCTLDYDEAWKLLVSVRLAAQCTDARVNVVVKDLFAKYPSPAALAAATPEEIEEIVKPCGLGKSKASQPDYGRCFWKAGNCYRYTLHPPYKPDGTRGRHQRPEEGRDGSLENHSRREGKRLLPPPC